MGRYKDYHRGSRRGGLENEPERQGPRRIVAFSNRIAPVGAVNSLAQTLLKLTVPGVPDVYQGTELLWDFSLVDPDNRRAVDYEKRAVIDLEHQMEDLVSEWRDGRIKQALIWRLLSARRQHERLFSEGTYEPLEVRGRFSDNAIAFARRLGEQYAVFIVPRLARPLLRSGGIQFRERAWGDTEIVTAHDRPLINVLTNQKSEPGSGLPLDDVLGRLPCAGLISD